ncbi:hypothetical protein SE15_11195 [Thermanaerothrix daxensis]|uniref:Holin n=2 Tax=Thermanaerothrix daxensis TaxID=869279 RepID=A0A0P6XHG9_9CHLR|nr:hypothetical protein SE15_11195 [Thermanaerothrix daxensis]
MEIISEAMINGIPLVLVVLGLVEWSKRLGLSGKALQLLSMLVGIVLGVLYQYSVFPLVTFAEWFGAVVYGLALGLIASGVYDAVRSAVTRG